MNEELEVDVDFTSPEKTIWCAVCCAEPVQAKGSHCQSCIERGFPDPTSWTFCTYCTEDFPTAAELQAHTFKYHEDTSFYRLLRGIFEGQGSWQGALKHEKELYEK